MTAPVLVLCLGNAIRRDDAVALRVADALRPGPEGATVRTSAASGLYLLDEMEGFDRVVVVDAVRTGARAPGAVLSFALEDLRAPEGPSPHAIGLPSALSRARRAGHVVKRCLVSSADSLVPPDNQYLEHSLKTVMHGFQHMDYIVGGEEKVARTAREIARWLR